MARNVFFSFHYQRDIWRVNQVRNAHAVAEQAAAGFNDSSLWEETKKKGDAAIKALIDLGLKGSSVTVVLIGTDTSKRQYVRYEIEKSIDRGNGLLGIYIHDIKDQFGKTAPQGSVPLALVEQEAPVYYWDRARFGDQVEKAAKKAGR